MKLVDFPSFCRQPTEIGLTEIKHLVDGISKKFKINTIFKINALVVTLFYVLLTMPLYLLGKLLDKSNSNLSSPSKKLQQQNRVVAQIKIKETIQDSLPIIQEKSQEIPPSPLQTSSLVEAAQIKIKEMQDSHRAAIYATQVFGEGLAHLNGLKIEWDSQHGISSPVMPDCGLGGNLFLSLEESEDTFFIPHRFYVQGCVDHPEFQTFQGWEFLKDSLAAAFLVGKQFIVTRLGSEQHSVAAAFQADGKFKIIDSMLNSAFDIHDLTHRLNQACLTDRKGQRIHFSGEYINTHLQKGGQKCMRFATLYAYQMFKRKSFEGYEEVNGAFAEGRLNVFEDFEQINGSSRLKDAASVPLKNYENFMESWAFRSCNFRVNHWQEILLKDLILSEENMYGICKIHPKKFPNSYMEPTSKTDTFCIVQEGNENQPIPLDKQSIALTAPLDQITLGSLTSQSDEEIVIFIDSEKAEPLVLKLLPGQTIMQSYMDLDGHLHMTRA